MWAKQRNRKNWKRNEMKEKRIPILFSNMMVSSFCAPESLTLSLAVCCGCTVSDSIMIVCVWEMWGCLHQIKCIILRTETIRQLHAGMKCVWLWKQLYDFCYRTANVHSNARGDISFCFGSEERWARIAVRWPIQQQQQQQQDTHNMFPSHAISTLVEMICGWLCSCADWERRRECVQAISLENNWTIESNDDVSCEPELLWFTFFHIFFFSSKNSLEFAR